MPVSAQLTEELIATIDEHAEVLAKTDELTRDDWLTKRQPYIGGSEAAASIGLNPYKSQYALWADKAQGITDDRDSDPMRWGRRLEESIGLGIAEDTGIPVLRWPYLMVSREWPWASCNVDFLAPGDNPVPSVVEVKNVSFRMAKEWEHGAVPISYSIQGQHMCAVLGLKGVHFFPLIGGNEGRAVYVERNDSLIESLMKGEEKFWEMVKSGTPPAIDGSESTQRTLKAQFMDVNADTSVDLSACATFDGLTASDLLERRSYAKGIIKAQEDLIREIENQLYAWLGNAEIGTVNGEVRVTWKRTFRQGYFVGDSYSRRIHVPAKKGNKNAK